MTKVRQIVHVGRSVIPAKNLKIMGELEYADYIAVLMRIQKAHSD